MTFVAGAPGPVEWWGGVECTCNRVGDRWFDQVIRSGHQRRDGDLDRIAACGFRRLRYPVLWERLAPTRSDDIDWKWTDARLARLRELGMSPIATLVHHGSGPRYTSLLDPCFAAKLAAFAEAVAARYPWMEDYTVVNEPLTTARFSALYGHWYPHVRNNRAFITAWLNQMRGTVAAMRAIRRVVPHARLIQTEDCGQAFGTTVLRDQLAHEEARRWLTWDLLTGRVDANHPFYRFLTAHGFTEADAEFFQAAGCAPAVIGLNYYVTSDRFLDHRIARFDPACVGGNGVRRYADVEAVRGRAEGIVGHEAHLRAAWERYGLPVAITETHLGCTREEQMRWLVEAWQGAERAHASGVNVRAVTAWALAGSFDWNSLVTRDAGHYEPGVLDVRSDPPRQTALAAVVTDLAHGRTPTHPALDGVAWWRRPERLLHHDGKVVASLPHPGRPLLITGSGGTLGRAFVRICERRGLSAIALTRRDLDIASPEDVAQTLRRFNPWAVINAAGYVRVDDAEHDDEACYAANVTGVEHLVTACRETGAKLVTFSSDLIFDGAQSTPYRERDTPSPLSVYGVTKAEAEQRVLSRMPEALVVRTGAFFGPWDRANFLVQLLDALDAGRPFHAATDQIVSPTYVPELVDTVLDLLIDDCGGIWHLANAGAVSWFEWARAVAAEVQAPMSLVRPSAMVDICRPAPRPAYSALTSERGQLMRPLELAVTECLARLEPPHGRRRAQCQAAALRAG
jgi:dTDP-4-dehydrorhamnose reductase